MISDDKSFLDVIGSCYSDDFATYFYISNQNHQTMPKFGNMWCIEERLTNCFSPKVFFINFYLAGKFSKQTDGWEGKHISQKESKYNPRNLKY